MEDSVTENEKQVVFTLKDEEEVSRTSEKEGNEVRANEGDVEEKQIGFINQLISNFTPGGKEEIINKKLISNELKTRVWEKEGKGERDNNGDVEEKPIGFINQIISNFAPGDKEEEEEIDKKVSVEGEEKEEEKKGGGGLFSHLMSNLVSSPVSSPRAGDGKQGKAGDLFDNEKTPEKDGGGGGIIDNIVSNLPAPLPDDAAPASDEACILIHSIIHD